MKHTDFVPMGTKSKPWYLGRYAGGRSGKGIWFCFSELLLEAFSSSWMKVAHAPFPNCYEGREFKLTKPKVTPDSTNYETTKTALVFSTWSTYKCHVHSWHRWTDVMEEQSCLELTTMPRKPETELNSSRGEGNLGMEVIRGSPAGDLLTCSIWLTNILLGGLNESQHLVSRSIMHRAWECPSWVPYQWLTGMPQPWVEAFRINSLVQKPQREDVKLTPQFGLILLFGVLVVMILP